MRRIWSWLRKHRAGNIVIVFIVVQLVCIVMGVLFPYSFPYVSAKNIQLALRAIPPLAILSIGVGLLMVSGEFDLSVGSNYALSAYVMAMAFNAGLPAPLALLAGLGVGAAIGLINAAITLRAAIPSFIATLGGMMVWRGVLLFISSKQTESYRPGDFMDAFMAGGAGPFQAQFVWALAVAIAAWLVLDRHRLGNHMFAAGGNRDSATAIGVNVAAVKTKAFVITGVLAAFAGIISTARVHSVSPELGKGLELQAIAACVVGGVSLRGGVGSVLGIFLGAAFLFTITDVLLLLRAKGEYIDLFVGLLIIAAVIFNRMTGETKES
jgi:ribose/xylose/arabinose/galactoside ABC-type transport system permease subunit